MRCPHVHVGGRSLPAFQVCGGAGLLAGVSLACWLAAQRGLSVVTVTAMGVGAVAGFFVLAMATKVVTGEESLTFFHHALVAMAVCAVVVAVRGEPVMAYLDLAAIGLGTFLAFGRIGCLLVGCCHGRPWNRGVRYGPEHAAEGFPGYLVGVRLFPLPAVEAAGVLVAVVAFAAVWLAGAEPGDVLGGLVVSYACGRFLLEFGRGDADRRYALGFSEGQWSALAVVAVVAGAAAAGTVAWRPAHLAALAGLGTAFVGVAATRRRRSVRLDQLSHPAHVRELALAAGTSLALWQNGRRTAGAVELPVNQVPIGGTSLGILVSAGVVDSEHGPAVHYAFSHCSGDLAPAAVDRVAALLLRLRHDEGICRLVAGGHGVTHLFVVPEPASTSREGVVKSL